MIPDVVSLVVLAVLMGISAFSSGTEAALFSLASAERKKMSEGTSGERLAAALLEKPNPTLSALLFLNLAVNMAYFGTVSVLAIQIQQNGFPAAAGAFSIAALLGMITFCEMLPKAVGVLIPRPLARVCARPLALWLRGMRPFLPFFAGCVKYSKRLLFPRIPEETSLDVRDLEQAVHCADGRTDEPHPLRNLVMLSEITAEEMMRPRGLLPIWRPGSGKGVRDGENCGCFFLTEKDSDEIAHVLPLRKIVDVSVEFWEREAEPAVYFPWSTPVSRVLETLQTQKREAAVVVSEYGETLGAVLLDDILESVFTRPADRVYRLTHRVPIRQIGETGWEILGLVTVRTFARYFQMAHPDTDAATLGGFVTERLQRLPQPGDCCDGLGFHFEVREVRDNWIVLYGEKLPDVWEETH
ncbi:MAG: CNNM domain-containing protein [Planctomycetia bacterium]|nr:CNNM domain-containing protein [Planctomycetia bacterium]